MRANVEAFLAQHGVDLAGGRVLMAANPRSLGYCFNPISVFWCFDAAGAQAGVVVEVHNTYGDRHAYLVHPDEQGRARTDKAMYVSPFHGVDGSLRDRRAGSRTTGSRRRHPATDDGSRSARASPASASSPRPSAPLGAALRGSASSGPTASGSGLADCRSALGPRPPTTRKVSDDQLANNPPHEPTTPAPTAPRSSSRARPARAPPSRPRSPVACSPPRSAASTSRVEEAPNAAAPFGRAARAWSSIVPRSSTPASDATA